MQFVQSGATAQPVGQTAEYRPRPQSITYHYAERNVGTPERILSTLGGAALVFRGLRRGGIGGLILAGVGAELARRGLTGHCKLYDQIGVNTAEDHAGTPTDFFRRGIHVEESVTIQRPKDDIYRFWRSFENLPRFMRHLQRVEVIDDKTSRWVANAPAGYSVEWTAEIIREEPERLIAWRSLLGADVDNRGAVRFREAPHGRGTEVRVTIEYIPPAGRLGAAVARLFGENPEQQVRDDLHRLREILETGEIATVQGQPSGRGRDHLSAGASRPAEISAHPGEHEETAQRVADKPGFSGVNTPEPKIERDEPSARPGREAQP